MQCRDALKWKSRFAHLGARAKEFVTMDRTYGVEVIHGAHVWQASTTMSAQEIYERIASAVPDFQDR